MLCKIQSGLKGHLRICRTNDDTQHFVCVSLFVSFTKKLATKQFVSKPHIQNK